MARSPTDPEALAHWKGLQKRAERILRRTLGPHASRGAELVDEVVVAAASQAGSIEGVTDEQLQSAANAARRRVRAAIEAELQFGAGPEHRAVTERAEHEAWKRQEERSESTGPVFAEVEDQLRSMEGGDVAEQAKAIMVRLHFGQQVFPGQPLRFRAGATQANLKQFHRIGPGRNGSCPTCKAIAQYLRVPGMTDRDVARVVDAFLFQLER